MQLNTDSLKTKLKNFIGDAGIVVAAIGLLLGGLGFLGALWTLLVMIFQVFQGLFGSLISYMDWLVLSGSFIGFGYGLLSRDSDEHLWAQGWIVFRSIVYGAAIIGLGPFVIGGAIFLSYYVLIEVFDWLGGFNGIDLIPILIAVAALIAIYYLWRLALLVLVIVLLVWFIKWLWVTLPV